MKEKWNDWDQPETIKTKSSYIKRVTGELPEKESSKSASNFLKNRMIYQNGDRLLDIGGSCGHFLKSFISILDSKIDYTCIDISLDFILQAQLLWKDHKSSTFVHGDCLNMPFTDDSFEVVFVNLFHFFPDVKLALREALRVSSKYIVWRTPIGQNENYNIRYTFNRDYKELGDLEFNNGKLDYCITNIFTEKYLRGLVSSIGAEITIFERDEDFDDFDNTVLDEFSDQSSTKTLNGIQINGCLMLDWHYIVIKKNNQ